jgi:hypothetical protein
VKRTRRKRLAPSASEPTPDQLRQHMRLMSDEHQQAWHEELMEKAPYWVYLIGLHLRLIELEHMETAVQEFL